LKTGFVTDSFSSLSGLAAVAYGDVDYFREVQNQIYGSSVSRFLDPLRPSSTFESFLPSEQLFSQIVMTALEAEYDLNGAFTDYVDVTLGAFWRSRIEKNFVFELYSRLDSLSEYRLTLSDYVALTLKSTVFNTAGYPPSLPVEDIERSVTEVVTNALREDSVIGRDIDFVTRLVANNPQTKISTPPPDSIVALTTSVDLGLDYRGTEFVSSYLPPKDYYANIAYPGFSGLSSSFPANFRDSIIQGYIGYPSGLPLELVFNPVGEESVRDLNLTSPSSLLAPTDPFNSGSILGDLPSMSQSDRDIYEISLISPRMNGFLSFDSNTMSNGDLINASLIPQFEKDNADKDGGLNPASRNFSTAL
jgi:hypothetical protein